MPVNFSIKNVPDELADKLRQRAERNHRSLQRELLLILEAAAQPPGVAPSPETAASGERLISIEELYEYTKKLIPHGSPSSVDFIRQSRDGRYGEHWVMTGEHKEPE
jgi:plasmid stability protein